MKIEKINKYQKVSDGIFKIFQIFENSKGAIRPHFILTGPSGSGKTYTIKKIAEKLNAAYIEINAAALTKEGTSGNSLTKALSPLLQIQEQLTVVFVDEFDKLFISGNSNSSHAHETTTGVQNEFLKILEAEESAVYGDYGKYINVRTDKCLFVFSGAFNGEEDITTERLQEIGVKTEFLGRVPLVFNMEKLSLNAMKSMVDDNNTLTLYSELYPSVDIEKVKNDIKTKLEEIYDSNLLGARIIESLVTSYFINGGFKDSEKHKIKIKNTMEL